MIVFLNNFSNFFTSLLDLNFPCACITLEQKGSTSQLLLELKALRVILEARSKLSTFVTAGTTRKALCELRCTRVAVVSTKPALITMQYDKHDLAWQHEAKRAPKIMKCSMLRWKISTFHKCVNDLEMNQKPIVDAQKLSWTARTHPKHFLYDS